MERKRYTEDPAPVTEAEAVLLLRLEREIRAMQLIYFMRRPIPEILEELDRVRN